MAFYQYHFDKAIFEKLPFLGGLFSYIHTNSKGDLKKGLLFEVLSEDYYKIRTRLTGNDKSSIVTGDKVYVLPNCKIPLFKLKEYLKSIGATQVNDVKEATKILGHSKIASDNSSALLKDFQSYYDYEEVKRYQGGNFYKPDKKLIEEIVLFNENVLYKEVEEQPTMIKLDIGFRKRLGYSICTTGNPIKAITPTCAIILYYQMHNKIPVVNEDAVFKAIDKPLVIDQSIYESLCEMLNSGDKSHQTTAIELISNCDIDKSFYYLWLLSQYYFYKMIGHSRNKNFRLFREKVDLHSLSMRTARRMIPMLDERGILTSELYLSLVSQVIKTYKHKVDPELFTITLTPTEKYQKYAPGCDFTIENTLEETEETH
jgi:hypothetical protein